MSHPYPAAKTKIIHTQGDDHAIGRQHGEQCGEDAVRGVTSFFLRMWQGVLNLGVEDGSRSAYFRPGQWLLDPLLVKLLVRQLPPFARQRIAGVATATNQPLDSLLTACVLPDMLPVLQGWMTKLRAHQYLKVCQPSLFGCSSFIHSGRQFLVGRNLDFPGVCFWDRYPVIQTTQKPGALRTIGFTTAGNPLAGVTGVNEAQIYLALHQHYSPQVSLSGELPFVVGERVLEQARSLEDAIAMISESKLCSSWAFVIADGKNRQAAVVERQPGRVGIRRLGSNQSLTHTNFFQTESCRAAEFSTSARMNWDNYCRNQRMKDQLEQFGDELTPGQAVQLISDHYDPFLKHEKVSNRCIGTAHNIQSLVINPETMRVCLAEGDAPVQLRSYREYDLGTLLEGASSGSGNEFPGFRFADENMQVAKEQFVLSFVGYMGGDKASALSHAQNSLRHHWSVDTALITGILLLKNGEYSDAVETLGQAWSEVQRWAAATPSRPVPPEYFDTGLFLARGHMLAGSRAIGEKLFAEIGHDPRLEDSNLRRIARSARPYTIAQLNRLLPPYSIYAPVE